MHCSQNVWMVWWRFGYLHLILLQESTTTGGFFGGHSPKQELWERCILWRSLVEWHSLGPWWLLAIVRSDEVRTNAAHRTWVWTRSRPWWDSEASKSHVDDIFPLQYTRLLGGCPVDWMFYWQRLVVFCEGLSVLERIFRWPHNKWSSHFLWSETYKTAIKSSRW